MCLWLCENLRRSRNFGGLRQEISSGVRSELRVLSERGRGEACGQLGNPDRLAFRKCDVADSIDVQMLTEWAAKRMEMFSADSKKLFDDAQKVFSAATGLFTNGRGGGLST